MDVGPGYYIGNVVLEIECAIWCVMMHFGDDVMAPRVSTFANNFICQR